MLATACDGRFVNVKRPRAANARKRAENQDIASCDGRHDLLGPTKRALSLPQCHGHPDWQEAQLFDDDALNELRSFQVHRTIIKANQQDVFVPLGASHLQRIVEQAFAERWSWARRMQL